MERAAFYYPWYDYNRHWNEGYISRPKMGEYSSLNTLIIKEHIKMFKLAKISTIIISWWGIDSFEDNVLLNVIIPELQKSKIDFFLIFEKFSSSDSELIKKDKLYLKEHYFSQSNYKVLNNKPMLFLYLSRVNSLELLSEKVDAILNINQTYLIGDEVYWFSPKDKHLDRFRLFDEISLYNPHISNEDILENFWTEIIQLFDSWQTYALKNNLTFTPTLIPGFNDLAVRPDEKHPVIKRDSQLFIEKLVLLQNKGYSRINICSFNEWHEDTQIETSDDDDMIELLGGV